MKKRIISVFIILVICFSVLSVPTSANPNYGYFPLNYDYYITYNSIGTPELQMNVYNNTDKAIEAFEIVVYPKDAYGRSISAYDWGIDYTFEGIMQNIYLSGKYSGDSYYWTLYGYDTATDNSLVRLSSVLFSDGTVWKNTRSSYYEEANFLINNDCSSDGSYIIDDEHEIYLYENGYSIYARDWYIWNDGVGWVWFSDNIDPICTVWTQSASIKLIINNNPNLYKIINFTVTPKPKFKINFRNSQQLKSSSDYNTTFTLNSYSVAPGGPYTMDLWDENNVSARDWYVWNDGVGWVWFSNERGPACQLWQTGGHSIKLVYNHDPNNYLIYDFSINDYSHSSYSSYL